MITSAALAPSDIVNWCYDLGEAKRIAKERNECFAVYFCSQDASAFVGAGTAARDAARKNGTFELPAPTVFDDPAILAEFARAKINLLAKVPRMPEHAALFKLYRAEPNTLVLCAANGEVLKQFNGLDCSTAAVRAYLRESFKADRDTCTEERPQDFLIIRAK